MKQIILSVSKCLALASMLMASWAVPAWAYDFVSADSQYFWHDAEQQAAFLTYLALDADNASAYSGELLVPAQTVSPDGLTLSVKGITAVACVYCADLQQVVLSEGIESIGYAAFSDCATLNSVTLPASLTTLSDLSFYRDVQLQTIALPSGLLRVGEGAFSFCYALSDLGLTDGLSSIAPHAFYHCSSLQSLNLPSTLRQLGQYAFAYCTSLQRIEVHNAPLAITDDVFEGLDRSQCRLVVPHNLVDAYTSAPVWQDFQIIDSDEEEGLDKVLADDPELLHVYTLNDVLHVCVLGDAPAIIYDLQGHRLAVCPSGSGDNALSLPTAHAYVVKCGRVSQKVWL